MFKYFRIIFAIYLTVHFITLFPYAEELFGNDMPYDYTLSPTYNIFPNILNYINATIFIGFLIWMSLLFTLDRYYQIFAIILWYGWASLLSRNILIYNPGLPYVGWILLACALIPKNRIPNKIKWLAWFLMALGYTVSGLHKLQCQSWLDGTALIHILNGPLARNNFVRDIIISNPLILKLSTWFSLALEILFLPLGIFYHTRIIFWITYMMFHLGILMLINFTDLTLGVMMIHIFTFETRWLYEVFNFL